MKRALNKEILQFNIKRIYTMAKVIVSVSVFLCVMNILMRLVMANTDAYFYGYLVVYGAVVLLNIICVIYFYRTPLIKENEGKLMLIVEGYIGLMIVLGATITYLDIYYHGHILMFMLIYLLCSMLFMVSTVRLLPATVLAAIIVFGGLGRTSIKPYATSDYILYVTSIIVIGIIVQVILTRTQQLSIDQRMQLEIEGQKSKYMANQLVKVNEELKQLALYDSLTTLPNRHAFYRYIESIFANGEGKRCSIFMLDIDYFKQYNDFYGHLQGDKALKQVANTLKEVGGKHNLYAVRWGGEEFLCFSLTAYNKEESVSQEIMETIAQLQIEHETSSVGPTITVSIGVCHAEINSVDELNNLYKEADQALYVAKNKGRNGYVIFEQEMAVM